MSVTPVLMIYTLIAPCGAKYEFTSDRVKLQIATTEEIRIRLSDFLKALGLEPNGWKFAISLNGGKLASVELL